MSKKCKSRDGTNSSRSKIQCIPTINYRDFRVRNISQNSREKFVNNEASNKNIFPCLYTHQVTAYGFLHFYMNTFSALNFPALYLPLSPTSLPKNMPNFTFDAVTRSLQHLYATSLPSFTPRFLGICVQRSAAVCRTRPRVTISEFPRFAVERVICYIFFIAHRDREVPVLQTFLGKSRMSVKDGRQEGRGCTNACVTERLHWLLAGLVRPYCLHILQSRYGI